MSREIGSLHCCSERGVTCFGLLVSSALSWSQRLSAISQTNWLFDRCQCVRDCGSSSRGDPDHVQNRGFCEGNAREKIVPCASMDSDTHLRISCVKEDRIRTLAHVASTCVFGGTTWRKCFQQSASPPLGMEKLIVLTPDVALSRVAALLYQDLSKTTVVVESPGWCSREARL